MKCSQCKLKLGQYIEGSLPGEVEDEINEHLLTCEECKRVYEEEVKIDEAFKDNFSIDEINFEDITSRVMNSIDKDKYSKGRASRKIKYMAPIAAALFVCVFISPFALQYFNKNKGTASEYNESAKFTRINPEIDGFSAESSNGSYNEVTPEEASNYDDNNLLISNEKNDSSIKYVDMYSVEKIDDFIIENNTPYIFTEDGNYKATISGKGEFASEEGIGVVYTINNYDNVISEIKLKPTDKQISPLSISWYDNEHLIIVQGLAYGTLANGLEIVIVNVETGKQMLVSSLEDSSMERYVRAYRDGNDLVIEVKRYIDEIMDKSVDDEIRIKDYEVGRYIK